jgi:hypothetical protein
VLDILKDINLNGAGTDAFIFLFWAVASIVYSFFAGRGKIISILVAVYMAELIVIQAPFLSNSIAERLGVVGYLAQLIAFLAAFCFLFVVLSRFVFRTAMDQRGLFSWVYGLMFAVLQVGFLISVVLSFLPPEMKQSFAPIVKLIFISEFARFLWLLLPIAFLVVIGKYITSRRIE